ncbi:MAG: M15 family metallopeptidase [Spirochaetaceae bacterium]|jgi:hypothetical protein|nr:M15 family metallopeptidase [Spirochaetaceae bacterium]
MSACSKSGFLRSIDRKNPPFEQALRRPRAVSAAVLGAAVALCTAFPLAADETDAADSAVDGETVLRAYWHTYPDRVSGVSFRGGDWTIKIGETYFCWADARLVPEAETRRAWRPHRFTVYPDDIPPPESFSPADIARIREEAEREYPGRETYHPAFFAALYGGAGRTEMERNLRRVVFLGRAITVHSLIVERLARIETAIRAGTDAETATFLAGIGSIGGYNWREIRGTARMSYHAFGLAVDILGAAERSKAVYWMWERERNPAWMLIPLSRRWKPPDTVIRAFENEGFIWGGTWALYDNMHFEFRPEMHEIRRLVRARSGSVITPGKNPPGQGETPAGHGADLHHIFPAR